MTTDRIRIEAIQRTQDAIQVQLEGQGAVTLSEKLTQRYPWLANAKPGELVAKTEAAALVAEARITDSLSNRTGARTVSREHLMMTDMLSRLFGDSVRFGKSGPDGALLVAAENGKRIELFVQSDCSPPPHRAAMVRSGQKSLLVGIPTAAERASGQRDLAVWERTGAGPVHKGGSKALLEEVQALVRSAQREKSAAIER